MSLANDCLIVITSGAHQNDGGEAGRQGRAATMRTQLKWPWSDFVEAPCCVKDAGIIAADASPIHTLYLDANLLSPNTFYFLCPRLSLGSD